eukprot:SAG11_NODE_560_length_8528_cov_4.697710_3_plen_132_part_00
MPRVRISVMGDAATVGGTLLWADGSTLRGVLERGELHVAGAKVHSIDGLDKPRVSTVSSFRIRITVKPDAGGHSTTLAALKDFAERVASGSAQVVGCKVNGVKTTDPGLNVDAAEVPLRRARPRAIVSFLV